jgi:uncharacterized membrane protein
MKGTKMHAIRTFFIAISAISIMALTTLLTLSVAVVLFAVVASASIMRMVTKPLRPARASLNRNEQAQPRVWNDGKGTIIDL